jgi:hypothetical protein
VRRTVWRRLLILTLLAVLGTATLGCGGTRDRGKNSDFDRPTTEKK